MEKPFCGIPDQKLMNILAALGCAAVGMVFINLGLNSVVLAFIRSWLSEGLSPLQYSFMGFGFVFLVISAFFIHEAFKNGFFNSDSLMKDGKRFCLSLILLWLLLYCLDFIVIGIRIFVTAIFHVIP
jgi:hypothetical protein